MSLKEIRLGNNLHTDEVLHNIPKKVQFATTYTNSEGEEVTNVFAAFSVHVAAIWVQGLNSLMSNAGLWCKKSVCVTKYEFIFRKYFVFYHLAKKNSKRRTEIFVFADQLHKLTCILCSRFGQKLLLYSFIKTQKDFIWNLNMAIFFIKLL